MARWNIHTHSVVMSLKIMGEAANEWAVMLPEVQRLLNNSETKLTGNIPFEMLHGYRLRFQQQGALLAQSITEDN